MIDFYFLYIHFSPLFAKAFIVDGVVESLPVQAGDLLRAGQVAAVIGGAQE